MSKNRKFTPLLVEDAFAYFLDCMEMHPKVSWNKKTLEMYDKHKKIYEELYEEYRISEGGFRKAARKAKRELFAEIILNLMDGV